MEKRYEYNGNLYSVKELSEIADMSPQQMYRRLKKYSVEDAINKDRRTKKNKKYEYCGEFYTIKELAEIADISYDAMRYRLFSHSVEEAVNMTPSKSNKNKRILDDGTEKTRRQICRELGISYPVYIYRTNKKNMSHEEAIEEALRYKEIYEWGEFYVW